MAEIKLNGKTLKIGPSESTVAALLEKLRINPSTTAVEINGRIISRKDRASARLSDGDTVEIIRFMGGG